MENLCNKKAKIAHKVLLNRCNWTNRYMSGGLQNSHDHTEVNVSNDFRLIQELSAEHKEHLCNKKPRLHSGF